MKMKAFSLPFLLHLLVLLPSFGYCIPTVGINYGRIANNLPSPENVVPLVKSIGATRLKLYDSDPRVLKAFSNTGVQFIVSIPNECLSIMKDPKQALSWVKSNVQKYLPATKITCIAVGNEVLTFNDTSLSGNLLPAMQNVYSALVSLNLQDQVTVTTAHNLGVLQNSYPPSAGKFRSDLSNCITQIVNFHLKCGSPFLINAYPFFAYKADPKRVPIDFVIFRQNAGIIDPATNFHYDNMLFAQIDAVHSALEKLGFKDVCIQVSETGWPSKGDSDEVGATPENAKNYNANLMKMVSQKKGTPMRPNWDLDIYVFALFNENMKPGPTSERNYGLFQPDGSPAYDLGFNVSGMISTNSSGGSGGSGSVGNSSSGGNSSPPATSSSSAGYLSITSDAGMIRYGGNWQLRVAGMVATFYWTGFMVFISRFLYYLIE